MDDVRFGIVGLGHGKAHLSALQRIDGSRVVAVCDTDLNLARETAFNEAGIKVISYKVFRCWVSEYQALPDLDANANDPTNSTTPEKVKKPSL